MGHALNTTVDAGIMPNIGNKTNGVATRLEIFPIHRVACQPSVASTKKTCSLPLDVLEAALIPDTLEIDHLMTGILEGRLAPSWKRYWMDKVSRTTVMD